MARILVVEDEANSAEVAAIICRAAGHEVLVASDGRAGWTALQGEPFDLVLADLRMPFMDGITLARLMRGDLRFKQTAILVVTARVTGADRAALAQLGVSDVILKPYSTRMLANAVTSALHAPVLPLRVELVRVWDRQPQAWASLE